MPISLYILYKVLSKTPPSIFVIIGLQDTRVTTHNEFKGFIYLISQSLILLIEFKFSLYINIYFSHCRGVG